MLARSLEAFFEQPLELLDRFAVDASEDLDVFQRQFERRSLEADVPRRVGKHEAKIDVYQVTVTVKEDVSVMAILNLKEVGDDGVS